MSITSPHFLLFSVVVIVCYQLVLLLPWKTLPSLMLLTANLYFFSTFSTTGLVGFFPILGFIVVGYAGIWILHTTDKSRWLLGIVGLVCFLFFWLKKYEIFPAAWQIQGVYVTIGLSYMFFRILQLVIDAGAKNLEAMPRPITYVNYILNFTTLISGPIQRYEFFLEAQRNPLRLDWYAFGEATRRIVTGFFKITVVASLFYSWHNASLGSFDADHTRIEEALNGCAVLVSYTIYLFLNFSGYTDVVIGVARFLGIELPENFNRPFSALNFIDFWSRWHMTLSNWLKVYVYNPLTKALMLRFPSPAVDPYLGAGAFLVTFFLIGLWHGQTMVFALYGLLLGLGVSANKLYQTMLVKRLGRKKYKELTSRWVYRIFARGLTFTYFSISLVCFWGGWPQITKMCSHLQWGGILLTFLLIFLSSTIVLEAWEKTRELVLVQPSRKQAFIKPRYYATVWVTVMAVTTMAVVSLSSTPAPDIVYKNF